MCMHVGVCIRLHMVLCMHVCMCENPTIIHVLCMHVYIHVCTYMCENVCMVLCMHVCIQHYMESLWNFYGNIYGNSIEKSRMFYGLYGNSMEWSWIVLCVSINVHRFSIELTQTLTPQLNLS